MQPGIPLFAMGDPNFGQIEIREKKMATYHSFDEKAVASALEAARNQYNPAELAAKGAKADLADDGHLRIGAQCISVTVEDGKICLNLPIVGKHCLPIPSIIPNGTAAEACLSFCTKFGIPVGVRVTVSVAGNVIITKSFGAC